MTVADRDVPAAAEPPALPPLHRRLVDVLLSPGRLFEALAREPRVLGALVACAVLALAGAFLIPMEVWAEMIRRQAAARGGPPPPDFSAAAGMFRVFTALGAVIGPTLIMGVIAGITTAIFAFALGDLGTYKQHLAVVAHAFLVPSLAGVLLVPLKIALSDPTATLNLSLFAVGLDDRGYPFAVLRMLDLFQLWCWLLIAEGMTALDRRRSYRSAAAILLGLSLVIALIMAAFMPR